MNCVTDMDQNILVADSAISQAETENSVNDDLAQEVYKHRYWSAFSPCIELFEIRLNTNPGH